MEVKYKTHKHSHVLKRLRILFLLFSGLTFACPALTCEPTGEPMQPNLITLENQELLIRLQAALMRETEEVGLEVDPCLHMLASHLANAATVSATYMATKFAAQLYVTKNGNPLQREQVGAAISHTQSSLEKDKLLSLKEAISAVLRTDRSSQLSEAHEHRWVELWDQASEAVEGKLEKYNALYRNNTYFHCLQCLETSQNRVRFASTYFEKILLISLIENGAALWNGFYQIALTRLSTIQDSETQEKLFNSLKTDSAEFSEPMTLAQIFISLARSDKI